MRHLIRLIIFLSFQVAFMSTVPNTLSSVLLVYQLCRVSWHIGYSELPLQQYVHVHSARILRTHSRGYGFWKKTPVSCRLSRCMLRSYCPSTLLCKDSLLDDSKQLSARQIQLYFNRYLVALGLPPGSFPVMLAVSLSTFNEDKHSDWCFLILVPCHTTTDSSPW